MARQAERGALHLVLTRLEEDAARWRSPLEQAGIAVTIRPCIEVRSECHTADLDNVIRRLPRTTHIAFASRQGVMAAIRLFEQHRLTWPRATFLATGAGTARAIAPLGAAVVRVSPERAEGLSTWLCTNARPGGKDHVLLPAARGGRRLVIDALTARNISAQHWPVYTTLPADSGAGALRLPEQATHVLFTSPSQVIGFLARGPVPPKVRVVSFGPTTSQAIAEAGVPLWREVARPTLAAVIAVLQGDPHGQ